MPAHDVNGQPLNTGDSVNIPCIVTSIGQSSKNVQNIVLTTKYKLANGTVMTLTVPSSVVVSGH